MIADLVRLFTWLPWGEVIGISISSGNFGSTNVKDSARIIVAKVTLSFSWLRLVNLRILR